MTSSSDPFQSALRGSRLVSIALLLGQAIFAIIIAVVQEKGMFDPVADQTLESALNAAGIVLGALALPMAFVLRKIVWRKGAGKDDGRLMQAYFAGNVTFQAVLEFAGLLNLTCWLITGNALPFVPVFAVLFLIGVVALFRGPTP